MSKTPRTDEYIKKHELSTNRAYALARQLETELADKDRQLAEITRQRNAYKKALEMAEDELMTVRAEIERLNKSFGDSLDTIFAMLLAARGDECDIDTLKAEMKPVSSKPSEYIKHIIAERDKLIEQMREALEWAMSFPKCICNDQDNRWQAQVCVCGHADNVRKALAALAAERGK